MSLEDAHRHAIEAARASYSKLLAYLSVRTHDVAQAEDALGDAFQKALETWPTKGVPDNTEAWLLVVAKRKLIDQGRRAHTHQKSEAMLTIAAEEAEALAMNSAEFPDERLKLLFICGHPAIDPAIRTPLMLQTVLGLDAKLIASAFLTTPATMSQRLVRAKVKIRDAGIQFEPPSREDMPDRLDATLNAIYAAFGTGWEDALGTDNFRRELVSEAIWLGRLMVTLVPAEPEAAGLLSLMLYAEARHPARRDMHKRFVPLSDQDPVLWNKEMIQEAEHLLISTGKHGPLGRFQLEAAIQSVHINGVLSGDTNWHALLSIYKTLIALFPSFGAQVGYASALCLSGHEIKALQILASIADPCKTYQPWWAAHAHALKRSDKVAATDSYRIAIGLTEDPAVKAYLTAELQHLGNTS